MGRGSSSSQQSSLPSSSSASLSSYISISPSEGSKRLSLFCMKNFPWEMFFSDWLIFSQDSSQLILISDSNNLVDTISLNFALFMAYQHKIDKSNGQDLFYMFASPWELAYLVFYIQSYPALLFISWMKRQKASLFGIRLLVMSGRVWCEDDPNLVFAAASYSINFLPPHTAKAKLASLPLGNINPNSNCQMVQISPFLMCAEVPPIFSSKRPIVTSSCLTLTQNFLAISKVTMQVIILVREAISTDTLGLTEATTL